MGHFLICLMGDLFHLLAGKCNGRYVTHATVSKVATTAFTVPFSITVFREPSCISIYLCMDVCLHVHFYLILTLCKEEIIISIFATGKELEMHGGVWVHRKAQSW